MSEAKKLYRLTNEEPGPRGVVTAEHGLVMVDPTPDGTVSGVTATLTDDEADAAERQGLTLEEIDADTDGTDTLRTDNRPAAGQFDPNAPDAAKKLKRARARQDKREADADSKRDSKSGDADKPKS
jgi:hypothetical protein